MASMKQALLFLLFIVVGCASLSPTNTTAQNATIAKGPWSEVPIIELPTGTAPSLSVCFGTWRTRCSSAPAPRCVTR